MTPADYETLFRQAPAGYVVTGADGAITEVNEAICQWTGRSRADLVGTSFHRLLPAGDRIMFVTHATPQLADAGTLAELSADLLGPDRVRVPVLLSATRTTTADGMVQDRVVVFRASERRLYEQELAAALRALQEAESARQELLDEARQQALHDPLTGLANRALLERAISEAISRAAARETGAVGLLFFDVNRFKRINDSLGHSAGDEVLRHVASCLRAAVRDSDMVARYSGDEFVILVPAIGGETDLVAIEERVRAELLRPVHIAGSKVSVDVAIGWSIHTADAGHSQEAMVLVRQLIDAADAAMYQSKARTRGQPLQRQQDTERLRLEMDLRGAAARGELVMHYQAQFDAATLQLVAVEALVRWQHPALGLLSPEAFIPLAEESALIEEIGEFALVTACRFAAGVRQLGHPLEVSVNVSGNQLLNPGFGSLVEHTLRATGLPGNALTLEITESRVISDAVVNDGLLHHLRELGVGVSVDDFGTGYSSLSQLHRLPVTEVKIDRSFIADISDVDSAGLIAGIIGLGRGLRMRIVAEGVETPEQLQVLRALGCDRIQGYLLGRPVLEAALAGHFPPLDQGAHRTAGLHLDGPSVQAGTPSSGPRRRRRLTSVPSAAPAGPDAGSVAAEA
jgi:diguanylate cyclase (GGDEF)-like protein